MSNIPKFELGSTVLTEEQFKDATETKSKSGSKGFTPGNYNLKIANAQYHVNKDTGSVMNANDPTWLTVSVDLVGAEGRTKKHYVLVPTKSIVYKTREGKDSTFLFQKLCEFMAALGVYLDSKNYATVIKSYFENLDRLNGQDVSVDIGFNGPYVKFVSQGQYQLVIQGEPYAEGGEVKVFADADSVVAFGASLNKRVQRFPEIIKFHAAPEKKEDKKAGNDGW
jgi:hypothetical protein